MTAIIALADDNDYDMLAASQLGMPTREQSGRTHAPAAPHLVRIGKRGANAVSILREQVRMALCHVSFAPAAQMHFGLQIGTSE
jgi:hypothetical protein